MMVVVTAANLNDRKGAVMVLEKLNQIRDRFPRLSTIWVDRGYNGKAFVMAILHTFYWCCPSCGAERLCCPTEALGS